MGECGCGNFSGDLTFPAPDGGVYVLDVYPSCDYCDTPAGVVLYRFTPAEAERWGVSGRTPLDIGEEGTGVPVMEPEILCRLLVAEAKGEDWRACDPADVIKDGLRTHFRHAALKTYGTWAEKRRKRPATRKERRRG